MSIISVAQVDFVGPLRVYCGSPWEQDVQMYQAGDVGEYIAEITRNPAANTWSVQVVDGVPIQKITDAGDWSIGDFVYVAEVLGVWNITGAADLEDLSTYSRARMDIKADENAEVTCSLDSSNTEGSEGFIAIQPDAENSLRLKIPGAISDLISPFTYSYDLWLDDELRQFGKIEFYRRITRF